MGSPSSADDYDTISGLLGHGTDLIFDFELQLLDLHSNSFTFKFENNSTNDSPKLALLNMGGRGGCKTGGRVVPAVLRLQ